jgi:DtxR family Mn-dependent transcriptional regulator
MTLTERSEEILETLWIELIEDKKEYCDVSILKDDDILKELNHSGYVRIKDNRLSLTVKGKDEARSCIRRHRLAERLFADILDLKGKSVHDTSCKFEHLLHKGLEENICTLLGHPKTCPHGKPIPEGNCCRDMKKRPKKVIMPLTDLDKKKKATVSYLQTQSREALQKMIAMGVLPNTKIILIQKFPSYVFQIGKSQFAIDKELAGNVYVRPV